MIINYEIKRNVDNFFNLILKLYDFNIEICIIIAIIDYDDNCITINFIRTKTQYQNKGYATKILKYLIELCKDLKINKIELDDCSDNFNKTNNLYLQCGFTYKNDGEPEMIFII